MKGRLFFILLIAAFSALQLRAQITDTAIYVVQLNSGGQVKGKLLELQPQKFIKILLEDSTGITLDWAVFKDYKKLAPVAVRKTIPDSLPSIPSAIDTLWGVEIKDPYRWLENMISDTTAKWIKEQKAITRSVQKKFKGLQDMLFYSNLTDGEIHFNRWFKQGPYYFMFAYTTLQSSPALFYHNDTDGFDFRHTVYDPAEYLGKDVMTIRDFKVSEDGKYIVLAFSRSGTDWLELRVKKMNREYLMGDKIMFAKFSNLVWWNDGFFYSRYASLSSDSLHIASNLKQQLCYHKLGDKQDQDQLVYAIPDSANKVFQFQLVNNYLVINTCTKIRRVWYNTVVYKDLQEGILGAPVMFIASEKDKHYSYSVESMIGDNFLVVTDDDAPKSRVLLFNKDSVNYATELIPQFKETLQDLYKVGSKLLAIYFADGFYSGVLFDSTGAIKRIVHFEKGSSVNRFGASGDTAIYYYDYTYYRPPVLMKFDIIRDSVYPTENTYIKYNVSDYTTDVVTYKSKDGTEIPMYITYKKGMQRNGKNPTMLYAYGGFGVSLSPQFDFMNVLFFDRGGILATPLIRGGGDFGKTWHEAGMRLNKQNTFDDFVAAAQFLKDSGYTSTDYLAIRGSSHGGLLVGAVLTQHPELCKVAIAEMGVFDMLRYEPFTGGRFLIDEFGTVNDSVDFKNLLSYSPYHNLHGQTDYPATLLVTAENDDRVPPLHTYKFLAALQKNSTNQNPHVMYFEEDGGHYGRETGKAQVERDAFILAFTLQQMGLGKK